MPQIELIGVNYSYRVGEGQTVRALRNVSFSVEKGEFVALAGMNGSGKARLRNFSTDCSLRRRETCS